MSSDYRLFGAHGASEKPFSILQKLKDFLQYIGNNSYSSTALTIEEEVAQLYQYQGMEIAVFKRFYFVPMLSIFKFPVKSKKTLF